METRNDAPDVNDILNVSQAPFVKDTGRVKDALEQFYSDYEYSDLVPRVPQEHRGSDILGLRTRSTGTVSIPIGAIKPQKELRAIWDDIGDCEKLILMLVSEHRHLTASQLKILIADPAFAIKNGGKDVLLTYLNWLCRQYQVELDYKKSHGTSTVAGLRNKIKALVKAELLFEVTPSYDVKPTADSEQFRETPSLFTQHYYLTPKGARVLVCCTAARVPAAKGNVVRVGYVPTHRNAMFYSIVHETECTEVFCSIIACADYMANKDMYERLSAEDVAKNEDGEQKHATPVEEKPKRKKLIIPADVCRFFHEKDVEEKKVVWENKKIDFKPDGKLVLYSRALCDFVDLFVEYDSGSSTKSKISHKIEAFTKYILSNRKEYGDRFRKPVMLMVSQKPSSFIPSMSRMSSTTYTKGIASMCKHNFADYGKDINRIACVLVTDCNSIRQHGAMGACWHRIDLTTGIAENTGIDLLAATKEIAE